MNSKNENRYCSLKETTRVCLIVAAMLCALGGSTAYGQGLAASPWPKFHANAGNTGQGVGPAVWGASKWTRTSQTQASFGAPVIGGDHTVYAGGGDGRFYSLDGATGLVKWSPFLVSNTMDTNMYAAAIASDGTVYAPGSGGVFALDGATLALKWAFPSAGEFSSPTIGTDGTVYASNGDHLYALNQSGAVNWLITPAAPISGSLALDSNGLLYFGTVTGKLQIVATKSLCRTTLNLRCTSWYSPGSVLSTYATPTGWTITSSPTVGPDGTVYFGASDGSVYAVTSTWLLFCGKGPCTYSLVSAAKWTAHTGGTVSSTPALNDSGTLFVGSEDRKLYALNSANGAILATTMAENSGISSSPAISSDGMIYFATDSNAILHAVYYSATGCLVNCTGSPTFFEMWSTSLGNAASGGASAAIDSDGSVYISGGTSHTMFAFN